MNSKFPDFDFDKWLNHFVEMLYTIDSRNTDNMEHECPVDIQKEKFLTQEHIFYDDFGVDFCANYLENITRFNCFMRYIMQEDRTFKDLIIFILRIIVPASKTHEDIARAILRGKSYRTVNDMLFTSHTATCIFNTLKTLQIPLKDDN